jgi:hypothetical protein
MACKSAPQAGFKRARLLQQAALLSISSVVSRRTDRLLCRRGRSSDSAQIHEGQQKHSMQGDSDPYGSKAVCRGLSLQHSKAGFYCACRLVWVRSHACVLRCTHLCKLALCCNHGPCTRFCNTATQPVCTNLRGPGT